MIPNNYILYFIVGIYLVYFIGLIIPIRKYGIIPRKQKGLIGIVTAPLLHSSWKHLVSNTVPILVLLFTLHYSYPTIAIKVIAIVLFLGGFLVWLLGRNANHMGASGLIYGLATFIIVNGFLSNTLQPLLVSVIVLILYGGLLWGIFPSSKKNTSWEGHLLYAIAGVFAVYYFK
ncbi:membrane associated rhomboid family serine protease [Wenyingzhuangia heitensis]|uniref:Membrane associated rhomboid family serine protease n=1 Tax=Wenyingzhuangia heitensis TaxID=1487859 RepID=A0ABX0U948_9FLAO|nr:rhomboid family intramembrane serine protease [Wenyingzhuangia heitensis]NIJ45358.1 membrane associated rhomboid family serine protease [Wenyingzhuangia heitensis]